MKRSATLDPNLAKHPDGGVPLSESDKQALVAFLKTLTDERFLPQTNSPASRKNNRGIFRLHARLRLARVKWQYEHKILFC